MEFWLRKVKGTLTRIVHSACQPCFRRCDAYATLRAAFLAAGLHRSVFRRKPRHTGLPGTETALRLLQPSSHRRVGGILEAFHGLSTGVSESPGGGWACSGTDQGERG